MKKIKIKKVLWVLFSIITPAFMEWWVFESTPYGGEDKIKLLAIMYALGVLLLLTLRPLMDALFTLEEEIK